MATQADSPAFETPTNREAAEAHVRRQTFRCRPVTTQDRAEILTLHEAQQAAAVGGTEADMADLKAIRDRLEAQVLGRCGADLTDIIAGAPYDGQEHNGECPQCGHPFTWRAPWFPGVDGIGPEGPAA